MRDNIIAIIAMAFGYWSMLTENYMGAYILFGLVLLYLVALVVGEKYDIEIEKEESEE